MSHDPKDYLGFFHEAAQAHGKSVEKQTIINANDAIKQKVLGILTKVKSNQRELEGLKQTNPKAYEHMLSLTQAMLDMAKKYVVPEKPEEKMEKAHPDGTTLQGQAADAKARNASKIFQKERNVIGLASGDVDGYVNPHTHVRGVMAGQVGHPQVEGKPVSSREKERYKDQGNVGFSPYVQEGKG
jgi:hypothetical protein